MQYRLTGITIYPVKSLGGISQERAHAGERGLEHDRRWMIADLSNKFMTQREHPLMAVVGTSLTEKGLLLYKKNAPEDCIHLPFSVDGERHAVVIWNDKCEGIHYSSAADEWISDHLKFKCRFIYMPDSSDRLVNTQYAHHGETVSFADGFPYMMLGEESLKDLNFRMKEPLPMNRFRPNFVFSGGNAFDEDHFDEIQLGTAVFMAAKLCARCVITTVDQETGIKGEQPLPTLAGYRKINNNIYFGQNLLLLKPGTVSRGDVLTVTTKSPII